MSGVTAPKPWPTARTDQRTHRGYKGRPRGRQLLREARKTRTCRTRRCPTVTESALRGLACKCPRCGRGKLYAGFLDLRPNCEACGLDYAFIDAGDGPAVFIIMIAGAIVVGCALIVEMKYQPPFWLHAVLWLPLILATTLLPLRSMKSLLIALQYSSQGRTWPADRSRAEMMAGPGATARRVAGFGVFTLADGGAVRRPRGVAVAAPGREACA